MKKVLLFTLLLAFNFFEAQQKPSTATENVRLVAEDFAVPQLNTTRRIWIYLPPDYSKNSTRYNVLYLQDGQNLFDEATSFAGEWHIDETLNRLSAMGHKNSIVVGIDNGGAARTAELSPFVNNKYVSGQGDRYAAFIVETLKPYIDKNYRTRSSAAHTTIGGSSLGGLISVYAGVKYPKVFGNVLAFSPAFWFNEKELNSYIAQVDHRLSCQKYYFIQGKNESSDMEEQTLAIIEKLRSKKVKEKNIYFKTDEHGAHNEASWSRYFPAAYLWFGF